MGKKADRRAARVAAAIDRDATNEALRILGASLHGAAIAYRRRVDPEWAAQRDAERAKRRLVCSLIGIGMGLGFR